MSDAEENKEPEDDSNEITPTNRPANPNPVGNPFLSKSKDPTSTPDENKEKETETETNKDKDKDKEKENENENEKAVQSKGGSGVKETEGNFRK